MNRTATWIDQFDIKYRQELTGLLKKLEIVPISTLVDDMLSETKSEIQNIQINRTTVIIESIISVEDVTRYLRSTGTTIPNAIRIPNHHWVAVMDYFGTEDKDRMLFGSYVDYDPTSARTWQSGSENFTDLVKRQVYIDLKERAPKGKKRIIREAKNCRFEKLNEVSFFLLVDNVGSGRQAASFLLSMVYGIKKKISRKAKVSITIIAWCASNVSLRRLNKLIKAIKDGDDMYSTFEYTVIFLNYTHTLDDAYLQEDRERARELIRCISTGVSMDYKFGFESAGTLTVFEAAACPNTIPGIFYSNNGPGRKITPLFENKWVNRDFSEEVARMRSDVAIDRTASIMRKYSAIARRKNVYTALLIACELYDLRYLLLCLFALANDRIVALSHSPGLRKAQLELELTFRSLGYIDGHSVITPLGMDVIKNYGSHNKYRISKLDTFPLKRNSGFDKERYLYYPQSIDGVK